MAAETSAGQQWKIPGVEVARLRREGVPQVPVRVEEDEDEQLENPPELE